MRSNLLLTNVLEQIFLMSRDGIRLFRRIWTAIQNGVVECFNDL